MKPFRNRDGLTLVELLVTIAIGSIVTLAATTVLLLGLRINRQSTDTVTHQNTTRIILSTLEDMASEAQIKKLITGPDSWYICGEVIDGVKEGTDASGNKTETTENAVLIGFDAKKNRICTGGTVQTITTITKDSENNEVRTSGYTYILGTPILEGVYASHATLDSQLLTFAIQTEEGSYTSSTYCRMAPESIDTDPSKDTAIGTTIGDMKDDSSPESTTQARAEFLKLATSQRGSPGLIFYEGYSTGTYYTEWYIGQENWNKNGWNKDTPWCACFITWTLQHDKVTSKLKTPLVKKQSNVDLFIEYLNTEENNTKWYPCQLSADKTKSVITYNINKINKQESEKYVVTPGDLIFFDWTVDDVYDADHVGIVLAVNGGYIYTIEGNSADMVAVRRYAKDDPRIMGYGVLDWKTNSELGAN